jgi:hypothetical protein
MAASLPSETIKAREKTIGLSFDEIISLDADVLNSHIENKIGKKMEFSKNDLRVPVRGSVLLFNNRFFNSNRR